MIHPTAVIDPKAEVDLFQDQYQFTQSSGVKAGPDADSASPAQHQRQLAVSRL
ncbi:MAG: hypothetical protein JO170_21860 [Verrucomicrobia bacterium]|nr:hypothetical protein [Verrucomicrobiota bacterium]